MLDPDFEAVRVGRVEAVKLLSTARPEDVDRLRQINPDMFIMVRLFASFQDRVVRADEFASWVEADMAQPASGDAAYGGRRLTTRTTSKIGAPSRREKNISVCGARPRSASAASKASRRGKMVSCGK